MSKFLGPIHHWLFNKIVLFEELEKAIVNNVESDMNVNLDEIVNKAKESLGDYVPNASLEDLIDTTNIHGWLQSKINVAETRHAKIISDIINTHGNEALTIIKNTYKEQGKTSGLDAKIKSDLNTPGDMFKTLNNYLLDGMPCDNVNNIIINEENLLQWDVKNCLHKKYWNNVSNDINIFYELRKGWIEQFVNNANSDMTYVFTVNDNVLVNKIIKV